MSRPIEDRGPLSALDEERLHGALGDAENVAEQATLWLEGTLIGIGPLSRFVEESIGRVPTRPLGGGRQRRVSDVARWAPGAIIDEQTA